MIEKSRLEELIEQEATIWVVYDEDRMERIKLVVRMMGVSVDEYNKLHDCEPMLYSQFCGVFRDICPISWLFETKEDAEWHKEFGCIERIERLKLPTWEEWKENCCFGFTSVKGEPLVIEKIITFDFNDNDSEEYIGITDVRDYDHNMLFKELATKENYTLACRKAKSLFLGEME